MCCQEKFYVVGENFYAGGSDAARRDRQPALYSLHQFEPPACRCSPDDGQGMLRIGQARYSSPAVPQVCFPNTMLNHTLSCSGSGIFPFKQFKNHNSFVRQYSLRQSFFAFAPAAIPSRCVPVLSPFKVSTLSRSVPSPHPNWPYTSSGRTPRLRDIRPLCMHTVQHYAIDC